jgi:hypothetical protein
MLRIDRRVHTPFPQDSVAPVQRVVYQRRLTSGYAKLRQEVA